MYKYNVSNHIEKVKNEVAKLLEGDNSGHGLEHINRVLYLSLKFSEKENANKYIVSLIALLHDADVIFCERKEWIGIEERSSA